MTQSPNRHAWESRGRASACVRGLDWEKRGSRHRDLAGEGAWAISNLIEGIIEKKAQLLSTTCAFNAACLPAPQANKSLKPHPASDSQAQAHIVASVLCQVK